MKARSRWLRTYKFVKKYFSDTGLSEVKNTRITAYTQIWQLEETKNDYWSNEGQDYIENNQHKNICSIENKSNTGRPKAPILFRTRQVLFKLRPITWIITDRVLTKTLEYWPKSQDDLDKKLNAVSTTWRNNWLFVERRPRLQRQNRNRYSLT